MTEHELLHSMSRQIGELVRHVAEVRKSYKNLEAKVDTGFAELHSEIGSMKDDIGAMKGDIAELKEGAAETHRRLDELNQKIDERTDFLASKIDHWIQFSTDEQGRLRKDFELERHMHSYFRDQVERRLSDIEGRLDKLEAARVE